MLRAPEDFMTNTLLTRLLRAVLGVTRVDRIYAFDQNARLTEHVMVDAKAPAEPTINEFMQSLVSKALSQGQLVLSNNTFTDPSQAPTTNIGINNLRIYVVLPIPNVGAIFLDQAIGVGVVPRQTIDILFNALQDIANTPDADSLTDEQIAERFAVA
jgi:hypothetical protein